MKLQEIIKLSQSRLKLPTGRPIDWILKELKAVDIRQSPEILHKIVRSNT